ncbi:TorF family putative porin [Brevundimonas sp.]|uniref:TorF family putative porin n=1 Tax=Brevundimonas sp. TaxID=1871086 RepID=UPI0028ABAFD3|nr:TorF family putative porin [Brevundimonas sp.]
MRKRNTTKASGANDALIGGACLVAIIALGLCSSPARAEENTGPDVAFNAAAASDYVFRGVSQTESDPAISVGVDVTQGAFYAGAWAGNVSFAGDADTDAEIDLYAGVRPEFAGFNWDFGVVSYFYAGQPDGADYDYVELKAATSRAVGPATLGAAIYWSPDFFGAAEDEATYAEINGAISPADRWTLSAAVGRQWVSSDFDYTTWNLGAAYQLTENLALDVRYFDTDEHDFGSAYDSRAVASVKATF